jgi:hypothetical protein
MRAWLATGVSDALFSSVLSAFFYGSTVARLWQGVATTALGANVPANGTTQVVVGLLVHFTVALVWSTLFLLAYENLTWLRRATATRNGMLRAAAIYGALIWVVMSMVVIRLGTGRAPAITIRWWIQFFGHAIFVGLPIVAMIRRPGARD